MGDDRWEADKSFATTGQAIVVDLTKAAQSTYLGTGTVAGIEMLSLQTGAGNDRIKTLSAGHNDVVATNGGNDIVEVAGGRDVAALGAGTDTLIVDWSRLAGNVYHHSFTGTPADGYSGVFFRDDDRYYERVDFSGVERFEIKGGSGHDQLRAGDGNDVLNGNGGDDSLDAGGGNDTLNGGAGNDALTGGAGNDAYYVDSAADRVLEAAGGGLDRVNSTVSYTLAAGTAVETLSTTNAAGVAAINLTGNELANTLLGNAGANVLKGGDGNDTLNGGAGNDTLDGGAGSDTYLVDSAGDRVLEAVGGGSDRVNTARSFTLAAGAEVETLSTTNAAGVAAINLTGNEFANALLGNAGANVLTGGAGSDKLTGYAGNDILKGGAGNDTLNGGGGNDTFLFNTALNATSNVDRVTDFNVSADTIQLDNDEIFTALTSLGVLATSAFAIGAAAADVQDRIIYNQSTGALIYDPDGLGGAKQVQFATLSANLGLTHADFLVV